MQNKALMSAMEGDWKIKRHHSWVSRKRRAIERWREDTGTWSPEGRRCQTAWSLSAGENDPSEIGIKGATEWLCGQITCIYSPIMSSIVCDLLQGCCGVDRYRRRWVRITGERGGQGQTQVRPGVQQEPGWPWLLRGPEWPEHTGRALFNVPKCHYTWNWGQHQSAPMSHEPSSGLQK